MIYNQSKRYQLVFWESEDRRGGIPALKLEFDSPVEAAAAFAASKAEGRYLSGIFIEWHQNADDWTLVERYPV